MGNSTLRRYLRSSLSKVAVMAPLRKRAVLLSADALALAMAVVTSRFILEVECCVTASGRKLGLIQGAFFISALLLMHLCGAHRTVLRYAKHENLINTAWPVTLAGVLCAGLAIPLDIAKDGISFVYVAVLTACFLLFASRMAAIALLSGGVDRAGKQERVAIFGADGAARQLARALFESRTYVPVMFLDERSSFIGRVLCGLEVRSAHGLDDYRQRRAVSQIFFAQQGLSVARKAELTKHFVALGFQVKLVPSADEIASGQFKIDDVREVQIEDLLGRDPVEPSPQLLDASIKGRSVMVTGAGGSIGSELCRQVLRRKPLRLIAVDCSEFALYTIEQELREASAGWDVVPEVVPVLSCIGHSRLMARTLKRYAVDTVYHTAAYKHVPMVEANTLPAIYNNVLATDAFLNQVARSSVSTFVLVSSDKAVRPTSVMGATKRIQEMIVDSALGGSKSCVYCKVRFGNVLGSSGSVVPRFREQIRSGGPVTVTHADITRYFMTIPEAVQLVIQAGAIAEGGEVFILDMGRPIRIADMAARMIELSGKTLKHEGNPSGDIALAFTGLRPGEKMYEELVIGNDVRGTAHPRISFANEAPVNRQLFARRMLEIQACVEGGDELGARMLIAEMVEGRLALTGGKAETCVDLRSAEAETMAYPTRNADRQRAA